MAFTDADLRRVRGEVGTAPSDDDLADLYDAAAAEGVPEAVRWAAVAAHVLGMRLADQLAGSTSLSIPGAISVATTAGNPVTLRAQVDRLRAIAGTAPATGYAAGGVLTRPSHRTRVDWPVLPPRH